MRGAVVGAEGVVVELQSAVLDEEGVPDVVSAKGVEHPVDVVEGGGDLGGYRPKPPAERCDASLGMWAMGGT